MKPPSHRPSSFETPAARAPQDKGIDFGFRNASLPGVGDLIERLGAETLGGAGNGAAAERAVKFHCRFVIGQRPYHQALEPALRQVLARGREQPAAKSEALEFRPQVKLVDFAVIEQAARAISSVIGITGEGFAELQHGDAAAFADRRIPPVRAAAIDELVEFVAGDDALIGGAPGVVMCSSDGFGVGGLGPADVYKGRTHLRIRATTFAPFKPYDYRSVAGVDYWTQFGLMSIIGEPNHALR